MADQIKIQTNFFDDKAFSDNFCGSEGCEIPAVKKQKPTLIYVFDGLCSYCYGFDTQLFIIRDELKAEVDLKIISGGMNIGKDTPRIKEKLGETFRKDYQQVVQITGANISENYLAGTVDSENYIVNSEIPARAFSTFKSLPEMKDKHLDFVFAMHQNLYVNGLNPNEDELYKKTALAFGLNADEFLVKMKSPEALEWAYQDFDLAKQIGSDLFPQLYLQQDNQTERVLRVYAKAPLAIRKIREKIEELTH
ncbi:DsbA family protein [Chryseobacterium oryzae]|uniref:DsbA family protein n=1 Tax=Chryseobacterium oryzae TaxID=2929799 RepID=A0ABY4BEF8_9FLAO|nr:DsbA family protein [Chryseobacterium oryzae]UOE37553.1 DsbA family protein [Chryseobacterium oryzae]